MDGAEGKVAAWRDRGEDPYRRVRLAVALAFMTAATLIFLLLRGNWWWWIPGGLLYIVAMMVAEGNGDRGPSTDRLLRKHIDRDRYGGQIALRRRGVETGRDEGVLWFEEGLLHFEGSETSFQIAGRKFMKDDEGFYPILERLAVPLGEGEDATTLVLASGMRFREGSSRPARWAFEDELKSWADRDPKPEQLEILPPLNLQRDAAFVRSWLAWERQTAVVALPFVVLMLVLPEGQTFQPALGRAWAVSFVVIVAGLSIGVLRFLRARRVARYRELFPDDPLWAKE